MERGFGNGTGQWPSTTARGRCLLKSARRVTARLDAEPHWSGEGELLRIEDSAQGIIRHDTIAAPRPSPAESWRGTESRSMLLTKLIT